MNRFGEQCIDKSSVNLVETLIAIRGNGNDSNDKLALWSDTRELTLA